MGSRTFPGEAWLEEVGEFGVAVGDVRAFARECDEHVRERRERLVDRLS